MPPSLRALNLWEAGTCADGPKLGCALRLPSGHAELNASGVLRRLAKLPESGYVMTADEMRAVGLHGGAGGVVYRERAVGAEGEGGGGRGLGGGAAGDAPPEAMERVYVLPDGSCIGEADAPPEAPPSALEAACQLLPMGMPHNARDPVGVGNAYDQLYVVAVVGDPGVGKTCLLERFTRDAWADPGPTVGVDVRARSFRLFHPRDASADATLRVQLWDAGGADAARPDSFNSIYTGVHGVLVVYDSSDAASLQRVGSWLETVGRFAPAGVCRMVVAAKEDGEPPTPEAAWAAASAAAGGGASPVAPRRPKRASLEDARRIARRHHVPYAAVSALDGAGVDEAVALLTHDMFEARERAERERRTLTARQREHKRSHSPHQPRRDHRTGTFLPEGTDEPMAYYSRRDEVDDDDDGAGGGRRRGRSRERGGADGDDDEEEDNWFMRALKCCLPKPPTKPPPPKTPCCNVPCGAPKCCDLSGCLRALCSCSSCCGGRGGGGGAKPSSSSSRCSTCCEHPHSDSDDDDGSSVSSTPLSTPRGDSSVTSSAPSTPRDGAKATPAAGKDKGKGKGAMTKEDKEREARRRERRKTCGTRCCECLGGACGALRKCTAGIGMCLFAPIGLVGVGVMGCAKCVGGACQKCSLPSCKCAPPALPQCALPKCPSCVPEGGFLAACGRCLEGPRALAGAAAGACAACAGGCADGVRNCVAASAEECVGLCALCTPGGARLLRRCCCRSCLPPAPLR